MVGIGACVSIQFGVNEACKRVLKNYRKENKVPNPNQLSLLQLATCGSIAGLVNAVVSIPVEHIRIKMQVEGTKLIKKYSGSFDCLMKIYKEHGIYGIYKGGAPTLPREAISYFFYLYQLKFPLCCIYLLLFYILFIDKCMRYIKIDFSVLYSSLAVVPLA